MSSVKDFLKRKNINVSGKTYFVDAMGGMAQGLFASLLVGTILTTISKYIGMIDGAFSDSPMPQVLWEYSSLLSSLLNSVRPSPRRPRSTSS